jgi:hypothetical protein
MDPTQVRNINKWLKNNYGKDLLSRPIFRLVWSEDEIEKRAGTFEDYYVPIYMGAFRGVREVKKYANPIYKERYILEKLIFGIDNKEIWGDTVRDGIYEPIWVFRGPGDTFQMPTYKTVAFVLRMLLGEKERRNQKMEDSDDESAMAQEIADCQEVLGGSGGDIASHLRTRSGVTVG